MEKELFALLRLGLGNTTIEEENLSNLIIQSKEWARIGELAQKHGVLGIALDGIGLLESTPFGPTRELSKQQKLEWIGEVFAIEQANQHQLAVMVEMAGIWSEQGCRVMVMKGQANGVMYPKPNHRSPGDIDCHLFDDYAKGNEIARQIGAVVDESWYKHSVISYKGETFENHQFFVHTRDGKRGKRLEKELEDALLVQDSSFTFHGNVMYPLVQWNAMFLTYHACAHFVSEGLRLKQILDWAMFLKVHQDDVDWEAFYGFCERNHLRRFADAMTTISVEYLGVKIFSNSITVKSPYAEKILRSALYDDDYVFGSGNSEWKNRFHLVGNLFHYRWKYKDIYDESIFKQLWYYVTGFLFKTEK